MNVPDARPRVGEEVPGRAPFSVLYVLFFMSGATGLIYEIMWNRKLTLIFGATVYSVTTILTVFFTGLALGAYVVGRRVDRRRDALLVYVTLEFAIGVFGLGSPLLFRGIEAAYAALYPLTGSELIALTPLRFVLSFLALLIPTTLLGATLPVLVKLVARTDEGVSANAGRLYAINSIGAALGTLLATTAMIQLFGVNGSLSLAGLVNIGIAVTAWLSFGRQAGAVRLQSPSAGRGQAHDRLARYLLGIFGVIGFVSMAYQVAWFRLLIQITGTSVYAFGLMLSVFIAGVGLGSAVATRLLARIRFPVLALVVVELIASGYTLLGIASFDRLPPLYVSLVTSSGNGVGGLIDPFVLVLAGKAVIAGIVFFVPTLMFGAAFPLVARVYAQSIAASGKDVGIVYAANTVGGVLGSFCGGFVFLPLLGTQLSIVAMSVTGVVAAVAIALPLTRSLQRRLATAIGAGLVAHAFLFYSAWNPLLIDAGPYLLLYRDAEALMTNQLSKHLYYYREGVNVNVSVTGTPQEATTITINGKPMASTELTDVANQYLLGHLPMLLHPDPRDSVVIGLGAGMTFSALTRHGRRADVIEISPEVVGGTRQFAQHNRSVLDQPNANVIFDDGRNYLMTTSKKYDVITEDPLDPFFMGSGYLYDLEHFEHAKRALKPGGVMCQYLPLYQLGIEESRIIMKTFNEVFPYVTVWFAFNDIILIGTEEPLGVDYDLLRSRIQQPGIAQDLREIGIDNEFDFLANYLFDQSRIPQIGEGLPLNTDDYPIIEFLAPRSLSRRTEMENLEFYLDLRDPQAPDLIDTSNLPAERALAITSRYAQYFAAREHVMSAHLERWQSAGEDASWIEQAYAAAREAAPYPIATEYLALAHRAAGYWFAGHEMPELGRRELLRSLDLKPDDTETLNMAGTLLWERGQRDDGLALFRRSYALDDTQVYPMPYIVAALLVNDAIEPAADLVDKCLALDPQYGPCLANRDDLDGRRSQGRQRPGER